MFKILLLLCSFMVAISAQSTMSTTVIHASPMVTSSVNATTNQSIPESTSVLPTAAPHSSSMVYTASAHHPNATVAPTHMPHSVNATSAVPTSSSAAPTPTMPPKPTPKPTHGVYNVPGKKNGSYCLLAELDVVIHVKYLSSVVNTTTNATTNETKSAIIPIPFPHNKKNITVKVSGACGKNNSKLVIEWEFSRFELKFLAFNPDNNQTNLTDWKVVEMSLSINTAATKNFTKPVESQITAKSNNVPLKGRLGYGYLCKADSSYNVSKGVTVNLAHVKLQPFEVTNSTYSDNPEECPQDTKPTPKPQKKDNNIVPIAVGCALAGLVLIVLIAYIIGRRKSQRGYEKV